jgi:DNA-binding LacI/PurR family transcriptional regulator
VVLDDEAGAYELTQWLVGQGKRRVLTVWKDPADTPWVAARLRGYERAMGEAQLEPLAAVHVARVQVDGADKAEAEARLLAGYLMEQLSGANPADAILAPSDEDVPAIAAACRMLGKDVLIVGWGHSNPQSPIPATVDLRPVEIGREMARLLLARLDNTLPPGPQRRRVRPMLVVPGKKPLESKPNSHEIPLAAAPQIAAAAVTEEGESKPLFGWKMEGGRWTLGGKEKK